MVVLTQNVYKRKGAERREASNSWEAFLTQVAKQGSGNS